MDTEQIIQREIDILRGDLDRGTADIAARRSVRQWSCDPDSHERATLRFESELAVTRDRLDGMERVAVVIARLKADNDFLRAHAATVEKARDGLMSMLSTKLADVAKESDELRAQLEEARKQ